MGFPGGSDGKGSTCNAEDPGLISGLERSPGGEHGNPLQYSCLENSMDRGAWPAPVHGLAKSWDTAEWLTHFHFSLLTRSVTLSKYLYLFVSQFPFLLKKNNNSIFLLMSEWVLVFNQGVEPNECWKKAALQELNLIHCGKNLGSKGQEKVFNQLPGPGWMSRRFPEARHLQLCRSLWRLLALVAAASVSSQKRPWK